MSAPGLAAAAHTFDPWNHSVGLAWAGVLGACGLETRGIVAEVGPGFTDKVGHGLAELGFRGTIVLVEPTTSARRWALARYRAVLPNARVIDVPTSLAGATSLMDGSVDAVVANHVLDDMLLFAAVDPSAREALFGGMQPDAPCAFPFVTAWNTLVKDPHRLERAMAAVVHELTAYIAATRPRIVAVREYPSWTHQANGLAFIHALSVRVMHDLERALLDLGLRHLHLAEHRRPHDPAEWLLMSCAR